MFRFFCLTLFVFLTQLHLLGSAKSLTLTSPQAVGFALENNKALLAAKTTVAQAKGRYQQAGKLDNPEIKVDYSSDSTFNNEGESLFGFGFEQRFPVTNRLRLLKDIAKVEITLAEAEIANQERLIIQEVELCVLKIAEIDAQLKLRKALIGLNQKFSSFIESRIKTAEASPIDANQVKIEQYAIEQEIQELDNERIEQLAKLTLLLGIERETPIQTVFTFSDSPTEPDLPVFNESMLEVHPEYNLRKLLYDVADKKTSLALAQRWSDIAIEIFFENERNVDSPDGIGSDRFFGIGVSIPLPLINQNRGNIEASRAYRNQIEFELNAISLEIRSNAEMHRQKARRLFQQANYYQEKITPLVEQNLKNMDAAYSAGQINLTELFRSQEQRLKIQSKHLSMLHDYETAIVNWKAATSYNNKQP